MLILKMHITYIGIGSNIGDREKNCLTAIDMMNERGVSVTERSSIVETPPWGLEDQPRFMNMVACAGTRLEPLDLLNTLKEIERVMGRKKTVRWGPRLIDLDILFYDDLVLQRPGLEIPHPLIVEREFVLRPLNEIAPDMKHPVTGQSIRMIFQQFHQSS
jgi:2-amino-4-hydroxy-6-hydroxymethyldihydropteridine diphosphokinase